MFPELTPRQEYLLDLIIREYVDSPKTSGVGSKLLADRYALEISSATIRNEMAALTNLGLLQQPHTSAGRIPTETAYRYFVSRLVKEEALPVQERHLINHQFHQVRSDVDQWARLAASVLSQHTQNASIVTSLHAEQSRFKHLELISTRERQVLMVLVLQGGSVQQQLISLSEPVPQTQLSAVASRLNERLFDKTTHDISTIPQVGDALEQDVRTIVLNLMRRSDTLSAGQVYRDGLQHLLAVNGFGESARAQQVLQLLAEHTFIESILTRLLDPGIGVVQVVIAGQSDLAELTDVAMVISRYGTAQVGTGALGVVGPTRMGYERAISAVRYVSGLLTEMVSESYG
ncbi:MAG TPA: heat-inducible transcriptional repressor HrcA [Anaerolineales bacterium]|nr:heat-inducible transcriptional repressor HrcA [Anaerolineales bacterium]